MKEVVLDTETTGLSVKEGHRIVEIGCIELIDQIPTNKIFHVYINPERKVSEEAFKVHGYSDKFLSDKKTFSEIAESFLNFIKHKKIIFMTWTTGILYAAIHGIPFIVYKNSSATSGQNKDKPIHLFDNIKIPFAENINQIENFIVSDNLNAEYLDEIKLSLKNGLYLKEYIKKNID